MRTFFVVAIFFMAFILFVTNIYTGVDLTSNSPVIAQAAAPAAVPATSQTISQPQVVTIQESPVTTSQISALIPVTGGCANPYTVQPGDSLSQIGVNCNTTLAAIRQANLQIINADLIYPGQQVNIPNGNIVQIPVTGQAVVTPVAPLTPTCTCSSASIPVTGLVPMLVPGSSLQVRAINFQPNTQVNVAIGPKNTPPTAVTSGVTDANGNLTTSITVPTVADSQILWVVVVSTTTQPFIQAMSGTFNINP